MKKIVIILLFSLFTSFKASTNLVYVCISRTSVAYHSSLNCWGLQKCTHQIKKLFIPEAEEIGKRPCKICY